LKQKQDTVELWEGSLHLLAQLPKLPDDVPVSGNDVYGVFEDLLGVLPDEEEGADIDAPDFLMSLGLPEDELDEAYRWDS